MASLVTVGAVCSLAAVIKVRKSGELGELNPIPFLATMSCTRLALCIASCSSGTSGCTCSLTADTELCCAVVRCSMASRYGRAVPQTTRMLTAHSWMYVQIHNWFVLAANIPGFLSGIFLLFSTHPLSSRRVRVACDTPCMSVTMPVVPSASSQRYTATQKVILVAPLSLTLTCATMATLCSAQAAGAVQTQDVILVGALAVGLIYGTLAAVTSQISASERTKSNIWGFAAATFQVHSQPQSNALTVVQALSIMPCRCCTTQPPCQCS